MRTLVSDTWTIRIDEHTKCVSCTVALHGTSKWRSLHPAKRVRLAGKPTTIIE